MIIAIDLHEERLAMAARLGAPHTLQPSDTIAREVRALTGGRGADHVLEVAGRQQTVRDAIRMTRRGGQVVLVGAAGDDVTVSLPAFSGVVMTEKIIRGSLYGSADVRRDEAWRLDEARRTFETRFVRAALVRSGGHRGRAAAELGVTRQGLTKLITRLGIGAE